MIAQENEAKYMETFPKFTSSLHQLFNGDVSIIKQEDHLRVSLSIRIMEPGRYIFNFGKKQWELLVEKAPFFTVKKIGNQAKEIIVTQVTDEEDIFTDIVLLNDSS